MMLDNDNDKAERRIIGKLNNPEEKILKKCKFMMHKIFFNLQKIISFKGSLNKL